MSIVLHEPVLDIDGRRCEVILNTPEDTRPEYRPDPDGAAIEEYCGLLPEEHADAETVTAVLDALRSAARDGIGCTPDAFAKMIAAAGLEDYA